jgi:hypothetical protein
MDGREVRSCSNVHTNDADTDGNALIDVAVGWRVRRVETSRVFLSIRCENIGLKN